MEQAVVVSKAMRSRAFLVALAIVHFPLLGYLVPSLRMAMFLPVLLWVNIPGVPLGMGLGKPLYDFHEFGVVPQGPVAWGLIEVSWIVIAYGVSVAWPRCRRGEMKIQPASRRKTGL